MFFDNREYEIRDAVIYSDKYSLSLCNIYINYVLIVSLRSFNFSIYIGKTSHLFREEWLY